MAGTDVLYNDVLLRNVWTHAFTQTPIRDRSDTDLWFWRYEIRVSAIVTATTINDAAKSLGAYLPGISADTTAEAFAALQCLLGQDRRALRFIVDGVVMFESNPTVDVNNGPKLVRPTEIVHIGGSKTFRIVFHVETFKACCSPGTPPAVLDNRWSCIDDLDDSFRTTRSWRGTLRVSKVDHNPQMLRDLVVPPLNKGFRRKRMVFITDPNGLEMGYDITDEEMIGECAPSPGTSMIVNHSEAVGEDMEMAIGELRVRIDGPRGADRKQMVVRCMQIAQAKLQINKPNSSRKVLHIHMVEHFGPEVNGAEAIVRVRHLVDQEQKGQETIGVIVMNEMGTKLKVDEYDPDYATLLGPHGTAPLAGLFSCYLQDPCSGTHAIGGVLPAETQVKEDKKREKKDRPRQEYLVGTVPASFSKDPYPSVKEQSYTYYHLETIVQQKTMRLALPVASASADTKSGDTAMVSLAPPQSRLIIKLAGERLNDWPSMLREEGFDLKGIRFALLDVEHNVRAPKVTADGVTPIKALDVTYTYAMSRALRPDESLPVGALPWDKRTAAENKILPAAKIEPYGAKGIAMA